MAASRDGPFAVSPNHDGNFNTATQKGVADRQTIEDPPRKDRNRKARTPPRISPPPLKRQRTDPGNRRSSPHAPAESLGRSFPTSSRLAEIANNISGLLRPSPSVGSRGFASLENPLATLSNAIRWTTSLRTRENDEISSSSCIARSERSNGSGPVVPICRLCHKKINKGFDPVIRCSSCQRPYHEACGKPPLVPGESWYV
ncbi:hypothetical protein K458DRAFT_10982 [Lentithecium fluviatile CBS 122367]|uniref:Uncharacterized protein n=1 Tax=Lentithecium fluviatile CBS 122367 TaxID=1168545 RepID=A0A6G1JNP1_9PLEO|nr:hypothetical protein K458DRAFT_10982 [Lentithecium fluviatile CBS 122367]